MWIKKTEKEIEESCSETRLFSIPYMLLFILCFAGLFYLAITSGESSRFKVGIPNGPLTYEEATGQIPKYLIISTIITLFAFFLVRANDKYKENQKPKICEKCNQKHSDSKNGNCQCGG